MIYFDFEYMIIGSIYISVALQTAVQIVVIRRINRLAHFDKIKIAIEEDSGSTTIVLP